ncbi:MAG: hypothetical protein M1833_002478 [Piccolia ochrophora]|nr:MAG: hypothetical protein M1833_002478 [Piccolia ochrophora]
MRATVNRPALERKLAQMRLDLAPLVSITTNESHPAFPPTMLHYWLLTEEQLNAMAHYYHQSTPCLWTEFGYPTPMRWDRDAGVEIKRRKFGRFCGLKGCKTPGPEREAARQREEQMLWRRKWP